MRFPFKVALWDKDIRKTVSRALREDIGKGDITTAATISPRAIADARLILKQRGIVAGLPIFETVFRVYDPKVKVKTRGREGRWYDRDTTLARLEGKARSILTCERVALNFIQHLSGIATVTRRFVDETKGTRTKIVDTRKTTPGLRRLEKYAVCVGGGYNHRPTLSDLALIKDNHIKAAGGIREAVEKVRAAKPDALVEVEVGPDVDLDVLEHLDIDIVMLDNWPVRRLRKAIGIMRGLPSKPLVEVSGCVRLRNVRRISRCGPDLISVGFLTHSSPSLDMSLDLDGEASK
jgi:nicotinate-nucleotide pyrophosphorylase (carboxylating)